MNGLVALLREGGWGVAGLALTALGFVWRWAVAEVRDARSELKDTNGRAWSLLEAARAAKANGNGDSKS